MARIALIGASGNAGSRILAELSGRGHAVTAIARKPENIPALPGVTAVRGDAHDAEALGALLRGHDAVVSSVHFTASACWPMRRPPGWPPPACAAKAGAKSVRCGRSAWPRASH